MPDPDIIIAAREQLKQAEAARRAGDMKKARKICEALVGSHPDYVAALHLLGLIHMDQADNERALPCLVRASMLNPQEWTILTSLGQVYIDLGAVDQAAHTLNQALAIKSDVSATHYSLGHVYYKQREYDEAAESFRQAIRHNASNGSAWIWLGKVLTHCGDLEQAAEAFSEAHRIDPNAIAPLMELSQLPRQFVTTDIIAALDRLPARPTDSTDDDASRIAFARANAYDRLGEHGAAWAELMRANDPLFERYRQALGDFEAARPVRQRNAETYQPTKRPKRSPGETPVSLFILGVSRSGKTTAERLISSLPQVRRGYENKIIERSTRRASQLAGILTLDNLTELPPQLEDLFSQCYNEELRARAGDARVFTNTHPGQISDVGRLADWVEGARFLFVKRDREDTALRIMMKHYQAGTNTYAYNVDTALAEIDWYHHMIDLWQAKLPQLCLAIDYEDMVGDPGSHIAAVAAHCGIDTGAVELPAAGDDRSVARPYASYFGKTATSD